MSCIDTSRSRLIVLIFYISIFLLIQATRTTATTDIIRNPYRINEITKYNKQHLKDISGSQPSNNIMRNIDDTPAADGDYLQLLLDLYRGLPLKPLSEQSHCINEIEVARPSKSHDATELNNMKGTHELGRSVNEQRNIKNFYKKNFVDSNHNIKTESRSPTAKNQIRDCIQREIIKSPAQVSQSSNTMTNKKDEIIRNCRDQESNDKQEVNSVWNAFRSKIKNLTQGKSLSSSSKTRVDTADDPLATIKKKFEEKSRYKDALNPALVKSSLNKEAQEQTDLESYKAAIDVAADNENKLVLSKDKNADLFKQLPTSKEITVQDIEEIFRTLERYDTSGLGRREPSEGNPYAHNVKNSLGENQLKIENLSDSVQLGHTEVGNKNNVLTKVIPYEEIKNILLTASKNKDEQEKERSKWTGEGVYSPAGKQEPTIMYTLPEVKTVNRLAVQSSNDSIQLKQPKLNNLKLSEHLAAALPRLQRQMEHLQSPAANVGLDEENRDLEWLTRKFEESVHPTVVRHILETSNKKQGFDNTMAEEAFDEDSDSDISQSSIDSDSPSLIVDLSNDDVDLATRASKLFKRVTEEINASRNNIHVGGLYDEYKKRLDGILTQRKNTREHAASPPSVPLNNLETKNGLRTIVEKMFGEKINDDLNTAKSKKVIKNSVTPNDKKVKIAKETNHQSTESARKAVDIDKNVERLANAVFKIPYIVNKQHPQASFNKSPTARKSKEANDFSHTVLLPIQTLKTSSSSIDAAEQNPSLNVPCIQNALKALETMPYTSLYDEYKTQLNLLNNILMTKQGYSGKIPTPLSSLSVNSASDELCVNPNLDSGMIPKRKKVKRQSSIIQHRCEFMPSQNYLQGFANALENILNEPTIAGGNILTNAASKVNMSVMELAERLTQSDNAKKFEDNISEILKKYMDYPVNVPTNYPNAHLYNNFPAKRRESGYLSFNIPVPAPVIRYTYGPTTPPLNVDSVLDQLIERLEYISNLKNNSKLNTTESMTVSNTTLDLNCTCVNPMEGTPCDLIGSWESSFLGIRLDIKKDKNVREKRKDDKKINTEKTDSLIHLGIILRELVPPREHAFMEKLNEWCIGANALNIYGGPLLMVARKVETTVVGTFVGYCRTCGGVDTIFGSWTFHTPSKDCQDITTSIFEKRDLLRRYSMDTHRRERYNTLYNKSSFEKMEEKRRSDE